MQLVDLINLVPGFLASRYVDKVADALVESTDHVNEAFLHSKMLIQTLSVNVYSTRSRSQGGVFDAFTSTFGIDGEYRIGDDSSHLLLTRAKGTDRGPFQTKPDSDWLGESPRHGLCPPLAR